MKILVVQQKMIGDVLTTSVLFEALREKYPSSSLHYLINEHTFPVMKGNPIIDKFVIFSNEIQNSPFLFYKFCMTIRAENYDVVIDSYSKLSSNLFTLFSKAKKSISFYKNYTSFLYTDTITRNKNISVINNRLELLKPLNIDAENLRPHIYLQPKEVEMALSLLTDKNVNFEKPLYMMSVLGSSETKTYPIKYMSKIIEAIVEETDGTILLNYIPRQIDEIHKIYDLCNQTTQRHITLDIYSSDLREFLALTKHCRAVIGNEGGAINMAKAMDISTFAIFSPLINKEGWSFLEDGRKHVSLHLKDFKPHLYQDNDLKKNAAKSDDLYQEFQPDLILPKLEQYLSAHT